MVYNHGMASYDPFFRYHQGKNQGITSFAEELLRSEEYRNDYFAQHSIVLMYQFVTGLKDSTLQQFGVKWLRLRRNESPDFYDLVYWVERERIRISHLRIFKKRTARFRH